AEFSANVCSTTAIAFGETKNGTLSATDCAAPHRPSAFADLYTFSGTAGQKIVIIMTGSPPISPFPILQKPDGTVAALNSFCSITSFAACIPSNGDNGGSFILPVTGTYTIEATAISETTGSYTLKLFSPVTITVVKTGVGSGTITSSPSGINCGATCTGSFPGGGSLTLA